MAKRATYEDVLNAPENKIAEILDGELFLSPRPATPHTVAFGRLYVDVAGAFDRGRRGPGGWWILPEPEIHLGDDVLVPDIAGWRRERLPAVPAQPWLSVAPDWICEVLSPSTARIDRGRKLPIYARAGVSHAWLLDPRDRTLEVLRLRDGAWTIAAVHTADAEVRAEPFETFSIALHELWLTDQPASER